VPPWSLAGFAISPQEIEEIGANPENIKDHGGLRGIAICLRVDPTQGIQGSLEDVRLRVDSFGANRYPVKKPKLFIVRHNPQ
jgi:hypothetical protein